jgi:ribosomal-protein-alanine N-acetyltransferase
MAVTLDTERLRIRPWREADVEPWIALCADARVMEFFPAVHEREQAIATATWMRDRLERDGFGWWIIDVKAGPAFAGVVALQMVPFEAHFTPALEVGWRLACDHWGRGYATEAARAAIAHAFDELAQTEVVAMTATINIRSQRVMQRLGMTHDPLDDFDHPRIASGHRLERHVLYRARRT